MMFGPPFDKTVGAVLGDEIIHRHPNFDDIGDDSRIELVRSTSTVSKPAGAGRSGLGAAPNAGRLTSKASSVTGPWRIARRRKFAAFIRWHWRLMPGPDAKRIVRCLSISSVWPVMFQYQSQDGGLRNSILAELCRRTAEKQQLSGHPSAELRTRSNSSVPTATTGTQPSGGSQTAPQHAKK